MRYFFILNPGAGGGKSQRFFPRLFHILDTKKIDYDYRLTKSLDEAYDLSVMANLLPGHEYDHDHDNDHDHDHEAPNDEVPEDKSCKVSASKDRARPGESGRKPGYGVIVAVGGDGTINRVLNGFYDHQGQRVSWARLGVIHTGTSPDFCQSFHIPCQAEAALEVLFRGQSKKIKVGKIILAKSFDPNFENQPVGSGPAFQTRYFGCCANIGLGPVVARYANSGLRKKVGDTAGTFLSLLWALCSYRSGDFLVCRDGKIESLLNLYSLSVGRTFYLASGLKVLHDLQEEGEERFYNLMVRNLSLRNLPSFIKTIYSGQRIVNNQVVSLEYSRLIEVYGNTHHPEVEFDGDPIGFLPCRIEVARDELDLIVGNLP